MQEKEASDILLDGTHKIYNLSHMSDFDGIGSAAVIMHYTRMPKENLNFGVYTKESIKGVKEWTDKIGFSGSVFIISDMPPQKEYIDEIASLLESIKQRNNLVFWIDHHPWEENDYKAISKYLDFAIYGEKNVCAAEILYSILSKHSDSGKAIAETAHKTDFNIIKEEDREMLYMLSHTITYMEYNKDLNGLREMARLISNCEFAAPLIKDNYAKYKAESEKNLEILRSNMKRYEIGKYAIGIGYSKNIQSTQACIFIASQLKTEISIMVDTESRKMKLRSPDNKLDCSVIAKAFRGGGHRYAAGGLVPDDIDISSKKGMEELNRRILKVAESESESISA